MKCIRCNKEIDSFSAEQYALNYGGSIYACPYCGKAYQFYRVVRVSPIETDRKEDDWGNTIIN